jgi:hypothetical protein
MEGEYTYKIDLPLVFCNSKCGSYERFFYSPGEEFYALLYLGLFNEARGENGKAENYMRSAVQSKYAKVLGSQDYMVDVAKVHCKLRHWT